ncbi:hypothetical protein BLD25_03155 [Candidatus Gracilibacteria bacterium GN02-872]|nr:hypothetical protein BLD25_03155 [Candidatus Gracilibacteria bacterium GN02-872]
MFLAVNTNSRNEMAAIAINRTDIVLLSGASMIGSLIYFQENTPIIGRFRLIQSKTKSQKAVELFLWFRAILEVRMARISPIPTPIKEIRRSVFCGPKGFPNHEFEGRTQVIVTTVIKKVKLKNAFIFCLLLNNQETKAYIL